MDPFATSHFSNRALLADLRTVAAREFGSTAVVLTRIAEFDERKLYLEEGYSSMFTFCIQELHYSEGAAYKRIYAARVARRFPAFLVALAEGRVHLRAILMLGPHLTSGNADELLAAATHKTRVELEQLLARRFPRPDLPERMEAIPAPPAPAPMAAPPAQLTPEQVDATIPDPRVHGQVEAPRLEPASPQAPQRLETPLPRDRMTPLAPQRYGLEVTLDQEAHDLLQYAQALMSHQNPTGAIAPVLKSALELLVGHLEKQKFAVTCCPRPAGRRAAGEGVADARHIPAAVKREVLERDQGQCTFVGPNGKRCPERRWLEFDHKEPVARGGMATVDNVRLLCRSHNQYAAERAFGREFMNQKRREARERGAVRAMR